MADLTPTRTFYEAQSRDALGLAFVAQLRVTIDAHRAADDADKALAMLPHYEFAKLYPGSVLEDLNSKHLAEHVELYRLGQCIGVDLRELERAIS